MTPSDFNQWAKTLDAAAQAVEDNHFDSRLRDLIILGEMIVVRHPSDPDLKYLFVSQGAATEADRWEFERLLSEVSGEATVNERFFRAIFPELYESVETAANSGRVQ